MSVEELRARLDKLSSEIDFQESLVRKLKQDRSIVQRQLNATLDPVTRLPLEISSEIFIQSLAPLPQPGAHHVPMLLLNICNSWSDIALSIPTLWAALHITSPCPKGLEELLPVWIKRARNRPLSMSLVSNYLDPGVATIFWEHGSQLKHLEIKGGDEGNRVDLFGGVTPGPLPLLETLTIRGSNAQLQFSGSQILELLGLAPNLVECIFERVSPVYDLDPTNEPLILPNLRRLMFRTFAEDSDSDDDLLECFTLPELRKLSLSMQEVSATDVLSFLTRSAPPLQELIIGNGYFRNELVQLAKCLQLIPTLTRLDFWGKSHDLRFVPDFLVALNDSTLLPPPPHSNLPPPCVPGCRPILDDTLLRPFRPPYPASYGQHRPHR
ncbi:hypothetical protein MVEN_02510400 [Mycena venus]|uniref:F-box domain-containing protein n=1 Tax=Mycena venus TaxID=2733690 RepID=A0A8H6U334_9AGAR|nr:hypothetical protein MVEN_02510400 [Mycena venus]